jgi:hypothetical protein
MKTEEKKAIIVFFALMISLTGTLLITLLIFRGCESNKLKPVHFKENYTPTNFNKL